MEESVAIKMKIVKSSFANAWTGNGTAISTEIDDQWIQQIISDGAGGAIITWQDHRNDIYSNALYSDIYAQKIDSSGNVQWTPNGSSISSAKQNQMAPQIISDGDGGAIITWIDLRAGSDIYAQRINSSGSIQWAPNGTAICIANDQQWGPQITSDGVGGAIITWYDQRSGPNRDIYAQRINSSGNVQWTPDGVAISTSIDVQDSPLITSDGAGGAIIIWFDQRSGTNRDIYAQRINSSGNVQWTPNGVEIPTAIDVQTSPQIISDGVGGAIITWDDYRVPPVSFVADIYAQRINSSGNTQWAPNGTAICTATSAQRNPQIISDGAGGAIITWDDNRIPVSFTSGIYAQRVDSGGNMLWTPNGTAISTAKYEQWLPQITSDGVGGAIISWEDLRSRPYHDIYNLSYGTHNDIYAQRINSSGNVQWTPDGVAVSTAIDVQYTPRIISDRVGGAIVTWKDKRSGADYDIYAQRIRNDNPTSNHPGPITTNVTGSEVINWTLYDDCGGGKYRVLANDTFEDYYIWIDWEPWINEISINTPINRTTPGVYNYTIEYFDDQNQFGIPDTVIITIEEPSSSVPGGNIPFGNSYLLITILSILSLIILIKHRIFSKSQL